MFVAIHLLLEYSFVRARATDNTDCGENFKKENVALLIEYMFKSGRKASELWG